MTCGGCAAKVKKILENQVSASSSGAELVQILLVFVCISGKRNLKCFDLNKYFVSLLSYC